MRTARRILESILGYRVPAATFYRWCAQGLITATRVRSHVFVSTHALAAFLALHADEGPRDFMHLPPHVRQEAERHCHAIFHELSAQVSKPFVPGEPL